MPSAELFVRLLPSAFFLLFSYLLSPSFYGSKALSVTRLHTCDMLILKFVRSLYLGASYTEA